SRTLEEAAHLSTFARELEVAAQAHATAIERGERERMVIERQRLIAEEARDVAEEARRYLIAELAATRQQLSLVEAERNDLAKNADDLSLSLAAAIEQAHAHAARVRENEALRTELQALNEEVKAARAQAVVRAVGQEPVPHTKIARLEAEAERLRAL